MNSRGLVNKPELVNIPELVPMASVEPDIVIPKLLAVEELAE